VSRISIDVAPESDHGALNQLYLAWGYRGGIGPGDVVYVATSDGRPVGLVRRTNEEGVLMLRGMQVDPSYQRQGIGRQLLRTLVDALPAGECYCIPFDHLAGFYNKGGFEIIDESEAPGFLQQRIGRYRTDGHPCSLCAGRDQSISTVLANKCCSRQALFCSALRAQLLDVLAAELRR
jgi:GNAT superfamily N-acetyltransferase